MADSPLTIVTRTQGNNAALKQGAVRPARAELKFVEVPVLVQAFRRMVRSLEFDVCEMAFTTYLCAKAYGVKFTALPVFLARGFHHGAIVTRPGEVADPRDLEGREVGVNRGYTVTTGVWARAALAGEHGVDLDAITWRPSGDEHVAELALPPNVSPLPPGNNVNELVSTGELPAAVGVEADRPELAPLIPDPVEAGFRALAERGHYPINHLIVVKDELLDADPDLAVDLFDAFTAAKIRYVDGLRSGVVENATDRMYARVMDVTGVDPLPYGIAPNRAIIDELLDAVIDQRLLPTRPAIESLFASRTHGLAG